MNKHQSAFHIYSKGQRVRIPVRELQFVEIRADGCVLHLTHSHIISEETPERIWSCLPQDAFVAVRRKFMINLHYISGICDQYIHMNTGLITQRDRQTGKIGSHWLQPGRVA
ncbi:LytTR family transcriptional regulator DNA-binding domain-containing protein [Chitinophaga pinensis]|uniref:Response regulator receiver protein n=1 Tax=Chitinophaga pinensis (strain ATCC 43595 / DSM 2588 / LMG 13176 / NBRC 15968 / NCIMB 11800 / UQM 2034) TaxID=485918 RepID=A0A979G182_CHIPD|nr:LytTR family transcriptional regulator DNA-binding domain-containing protein [Chitinophaga pinensis]ACU58989.1 response regulator receiver protein [Chitinophaga pinensis DSM 2588]